MNDASLSTTDINALRQETIRLREAALYALTNAAAWQINPLRQCVAELESVIGRLSPLCGVADGPR